MGRHQQPSAAQNCTGQQAPPAQLGLRSTGRWGGQRLPTALKRCGAGILLSARYGCKKEPPGAHLPVALPAHSPEHLTPASSLCVQSPRPHGLAGQSHRPASLPRHPTSSSHTDPEPGPKADPRTASTARPQPSWRHTTSASARSQESSHTVPQEPACQSSTRPEQPSSPPRTRSAPSSAKGARGHRGQHLDGQLDGRRHSSTWVVKCE
jgi:hypothetical protein